MAWSVLTWKILRISQSKFLSKEVRAETRHSSYTNPFNTFKIHLHIFIESICIVFCQCHRLSIHNSAIFQLRLTTSLGIHKNQTQ